ncbi:hypothetical protein E2562_001685 [Oryza meyeriana var. granulata]|uniref:Cytochrome P450 n=1 Tax=Oryza meyeriana var. granulata TaxID=110450 RepID=A0A6G1CCX7_9ORYZ|nr:hypothetical protein E2562_001685 [Oryza meyeriana var. granulata]
MECEVCWLLWAAFAAVLVYYLAWTTRRLSGAGRRLPPGPTPLPVVGNVLSLRGNMHHALARLAGEYGPVMKLKLGVVTAVVVSSPDAAREAFTKHDRRLAARTIPDASHARGYAERSMIWLPSSNPRWKTLRGVVATHVFSPRSLAAARGVRERKVRDIVEYIAKNAGEEVDVGQVVYGGVLNLVSGAFFSADVGAESAHGLQLAVEEIILAIAKPNVSDLLPFLRPLDLQGWRRWAEKRYDKIFGTLDGIVNSRLADAGVSTGKHAGDFLDSLLELLSAGKITRDDALDLSEKFTTVNVLVAPLKAIPVLASDEIYVSC